MANYYTDQPEIAFHLEHPLMKRIVELKERNYADKDKYEEAPVNYEDAIENYKRILDITGDVAANIIEPNSESVDLEGPHLIDNRMHYASKTYENLDATRKAGLWGVSMPRQYGGLNLPNVVFSMLSEMISSADGGFQNIWSLQSCIDTLYEFGNDEQRAKYIPRICNGETMSMDLTEPDAGSDLQRVMLKATFDEKENCWRLNGEAFHNQRRFRPSLGACPFGRRHSRRSWTLYVHLRQAQWRCRRAPHRAQTRYSRLANLRIGLQECESRTLRKHPYGTHQVRHGTHERCSSWHRSTERGTFERSL